MHTPTPTCRRTDSRFTSPSDDTGPTPRPLPRLRASIRKWALPLLAALVATALPTAHADVVPASFNSATDVPVVAAGYTAMGNTVNLSLNFAPTPGTTLTVVRNTASDFINGPFDNLANGAPVTLSHNSTDYSFIAWYYGGTGNDLVLLPATPSLATWGRGGFQIQQASTVDLAAPTTIPLTGVLAGKTIVQLSRGAAHTVALCTDGTLAAWGNNGSGQLGNGNFNGSSDPVLVQTTGALAGKTVIAVSAGTDHTLALCSDGTVASWGKGDGARLGNAAFNTSNVPVAVDTTTALSGKTVVAVAAGGSHNLALCSDGTLVAWGAGGAGQIGDNSSNDRSRPVAVDISASSALSGKTVVALAAGSNHSLVLCSDSTVAAWGSNSYGQVGDNSVSSRSLPVAISNSGALVGKTVTALAGSSFHSLALCSDGTLAAWGRNQFGQLGDNSTTDRLLPTAVNAVNGTSALFGRTPVALSVAESSSFAFCTDGSLLAWGRNNYGQLGDNSTDDRLVPVAVNTTLGVSALAGQPVIGFAGPGSGATSFNPWVLYAAVAPAAPDIAIERPTGTPLLSGASQDFGSVIVGQTSTLTFTLKNTGTGPLSNLLFSIDGPDASAFSLAAILPTSVAASGSTTFDVTFTPTLGGARSATLHVASNDPDENPFDLALVGTGTLSLAVTYLNGTETALTAPAVVATGSALSFSLGAAPTFGATLPVINNTGRDFISGTFTGLPNGAPVNLTYNGTTYRYVAWYFGGTGNDLELRWAETAVAGWGQNSSSQLGNGSATQSLVPVELTRTGVLAGKTIVQVVRGAVHAAALCSDGTVATWGMNQFGRLGINVTDSVVRSTPVLVSTAEGLSALFGKTVVALAAGKDHTLALCSDGTVAAWGYNSSGQLGQNSLTDRTAPVAVDTTSGVSALHGKSVVAIAAGGAHSLALCSDGTVVSWGDNSSGQLGDNSTTRRQVPVAVISSGALSGKTVTAIAAGDIFSLALCSDGTVASWGSNNNGELGLGASNSISAPAAVSTAGVLAGKTVVALATGSYHTTALCSDGTLVAWGYNSSGQLGNGSTTAIFNLPELVNRTEGTSALFGKTVTALAGGLNHTIALCADGTVVGWGRNNNGQLGTNSTSNAVRDPVAVDNSGVLAGKFVTGLAGSGEASAYTLVLFGTAPLEPEIAVEQPLGLDLMTGATATFSSVLPGAITTLEFTVRNTGLGDLTGLTILIDGTDASSFSVTLNPMAPVASMGLTTFTVQFAPITGGAKTATLSLASNDMDENPFTLILSGRALDAMTDTDMDGLSDATEVRLAALGFDWQVSQPTLVNSFLADNALFNQTQYDASRATGRTDVTSAPATYSLFTQAQVDASRQTGRDDVTASPNSYSLFSQAQYDANRLAGRADVTASPNTYDLFTTDQVQTLNVATPLIQRDSSGEFTLTVGVEKSTNLTTFTAFPLSTPQVTVNAQGKVELKFTVPDNTVFFRLLSQ